MKIIVLSLLLCCCAERVRAEKIELEEREYNTIISQLKELGLKLEAIQRQLDTTLTRHDVRLGALEEETDKLQTRYDQWINYVLAVVQALVIAYIGKKSLNGKNDSRHTYEIKNGNEFQAPGSRNKR